MTVAVGAATVPLSASRKEMRYRCHELLLNKRSLDRSPKKTRSLRRGSTTIYIDRRGGRSGAGRRATVGPKRDYGRRKMRFRASCRQTFPYPVTEGLSGRNKRKSAIYFPRLHCGRAGFRISLLGIDDVPASDSVAHLGKCRSVLRRVSAQDHKIGVHSFRNAPAMG